jgi:flagellar biosynthetic protein FliR
VTDQTFLAFLLVFVRCSAMLLTSPIFSAQNTPLMIRVWTGVAISGALTMAIQPHIAILPTDMYGLVSALAREALAGILLGSFVNLSMQALQMAGALMDVQSGLGSSHVLNPLNGVQSTVLSQLKGMLGMVVFLAADGHHLLLIAFAKSYGVIPSFGAIQASFVSLLGTVLLISLQIAAPVMAVGFIVDAALALMVRAVPQMNVMHVGMPAKVGVGLAAVALGLPMAVAGVSEGVRASMTALQPLFHF